MCVCVYISQRKTFNALTSNSPFIPPVASENSRSPNVSSVNKGMETVHMNTRQTKSSSFYSLNEGERRRGRHVWAGLASLQSWVPSSSTEPGESSLSKPSFESYQRLERWLRCNLLVGAGCTIGSAPAGPWATLTPWACGPRCPAHPCRGSKPGSRGVAGLCGGAETAWTNEFHPEWLLRQGYPWDFGHRAEFSVL